MDFDLAGPASSPKKAAKIMDMHYRPLGRTGWNVSEVSFGAWAIGGTWGTVDDAESLDALHKAVDCGVNFIDTADVYGDGRSERLIAQLKKARPEAELIVATKFGRRLNPHTAEGYNAANLEAFLDRSLANLQTEAVDLVQLHCPPSEVYESAEVFDICDWLVQKGKLRHYGVSVEKVDEALKAIEYPGVQSVQIIFNLFRQRPAEAFFPLAKKKQVGILARLPLSSGMLTGKITRETKFEPDDHRAGNREGQWFDKGETFSGVPFEVGLQAVEELKSLLPTAQPPTSNASTPQRLTHPSASTFHFPLSTSPAPTPDAQRLAPRPASLAQFALQWILMNDAVTCAIPGGKRASQVEENCAASDLPPLTPETLSACREVYERRIKEFVEGRW